MIAPIGSDEGGHTVQADPVAGTGLRILVVSRIPLIGFCLAAGHRTEIGLLGHIQDGGGADTNDSVRLAEAEGLAEIVEGFDLMASTAEQKPGRSDRVGELVARPMVALLVGRELSWWRLAVHRRSPPADSAAHAFGMMSGNSATGSG